MAFGDPLTKLGTRRWYEWPGDDSAAYSVPDERFIYEPISPGSNYYIPVSLAPRRLVFTPEEPPQPTAVYRAFDQSDRLLYVGISAAPERRWTQHAIDKPWWRQVARLTLNWRDSWAEALAVEAEAIRLEGPVHNVVHNGKPAA